jgi:hypothetical protein
MTFVNVTFETTGGRFAENVSFVRPGVPALRTTPGILEAAQFAGSSLEALGQIRSSEGE